MGFPTPLTEWITGDAREFIFDIFSSSKTTNRELIDNSRVLQELENEPKYGRKIWGLLNLELWQQEFQDKESHYKQLIQEKAVE